MTEQVPQDKQGSLKQKNKEKQDLLNATRNKKLWRAMISYIPKGHGVDMRDVVWTEQNNLC